MFAVRFHEFGESEVLVYEECPDPVPRAGEALVRVKAVALNRLDLWVRQSIPTYPVTLPHILGSDIAGVVERIEGGEAGEIKAGDEVVVYPIVTCGKCQPCTTGRENLCPELKVIGGHITGGYAQKVVVPAKNLVKKPPKLDWIQAAAYPVTFLTAWHMLSSRAKLAKGETVLVLGASAGVGVAAMQIAKYTGARVIAYTSSPQKTERLKALGPDELIACHPAELTPRVHELTGHAGVEVVFEHVGPATWPQSLMSVARGGRIVTCGATTGPEITMVLRQLYMRDISVLGSYMGTFQEFERVTQLFKTGKIKPVVDQVLPLQEARHAHEALLTKEHVGKIVLEVGD